MKNHVAKSGNLVILSCGGEERDLNPKIGRRNPYAKG